MFFREASMNLTMYSDNEKNLVMLLPDDITDEEIMTLGEISFPEEMFMRGDIDAFPASNLKPTTCINLYNMHASYEINSIFPDTVLSKGMQS